MNKEDKRLVGLIRTLVIWAIQEADFTHSPESADAMEAAEEFRVIYEQYISSREGKALLPSILAYAALADTLGDIAAASIFDDLNIELRYKYKAFSIDAAKRMLVNKYREELVSALLRL